MSYFTISVSLLALAVTSIAQKNTGHEQLDSALLHYDTLHTDHLEHSYSTSSYSHLNRHVKFNALGRNFHLSLVHNHRIFSNDFGAHIANRDGRLRPVHLNKAEFYHGYLQGDDYSSVTAHISQSGVLTASIITASEVYHIEPSHHYIKEPHPFHMIAYKSSHVKDRLGGSRMDYLTGPMVPGKDHDSGSKETLKKSNVRSSTDRFRAELGGSRLKRQMLAGDIGGSSCPMILVADFTVFQGFGGDERGIMVQLVQLVDSIDRMIYRPTRWIVDTSGGTVEGLGIEIRNITVHSAFSDGSEGLTEYNRENSGPDADDLLGQMRFGDFSGFCLAHLFTDRNFASGLLGLANIASPFLGQTGGICSSAFRDFGFSPPRQVIYNTGLTNFNNNGQRMTMSELILVTGHELGHSWGSHHDPPGDPVCRERWLMNEFAQDGSEQSHMEFSGCSKTSIGQVLLTKATCFTDPNTCGNFEVNDGEECDAGFDGDACCDTRCRFVDRNFECSDVNHPCCVNCSIADTTVTCRSVGSISINCTDSTMCNGVDRTCPKVPPPAPEGTPCLGPSGGGTCQFNGTSNQTECLSICKAEGQQECTCGEPYECVVCCQDMGRPDTCRRALNGTLPLSNGAACSDERVCVDGQCTDTTQDLIERIWSIIVDLDINAFGQFVRENMVLFVLFFSTPVWCIGSCVIHCCVDDGLKSFVSIFEEEETDAYLWFEDRVERYRRWIRRKLDEAHIPLLSSADELGSESDEVGSSKQDLLPVDPVDDSPAPTYN